MTYHLISYYIGIAVVFLSHIYILLNNPSDASMYHSYANIFAGLLIAYYFMNKEKITNF